MGSGNLKRNKQAGDMARHVKTGGAEFDHWKRHNRAKESMPAGSPDICHDVSHAPSPISK